MAKRVVDGEALWGSKKLKQVFPKYRAEIGWLIGLGDGNGVFECDLDDIYNHCYDRNRSEDFTKEDLRKCFQQFADAKILFAWKERGKTWGFFIGVHKPGRLPPASKSGLKMAPPIPWRQVREYLGDDDFKNYAVQTSLARPMLEAAGFDQATVSLLLSNAPAQLPASPDERTRTSFEESLSKAGRTRSGQPPPTSEQRPPELVIDLTPVPYGTPLTPPGDDLPTEIG